MTDAYSKTAVVTGAAGAIGHAVCKRLATRGFHVIAVDRDVDGLATLYEPVTRLNADLTDDGFPDVVAHAVAQRGAGLDLLVHNAGIVSPGAVEGRSPTVSRRELQVNLQAPILLTERLFRDLRSRRGLIVGVGSAGALYPLPESPGYSATKAGLRAYLLALGGSQDTTGVRVALVHPSAVDTRMLRKEAEEGGSVTNFVSAPISPEVVADAIVGTLDHSRLETFVPRSSSFQLRLFNVFPRLVRLVEPIVDRLGRRGLERYLKARPSNARSGCGQV